MNYKEGKNNSNKNGMVSTVITSVLLAIVVFMFVLVIIDDNENDEQTNESASKGSVTIHNPTGNNTPSQTTDKPQTYTEQPQQTATIQPTQTPVGEYKFGEPVREKLPAVDMEYFKDAVFIGDSRMEDFGMFTGTAKYATFYAKIGLTIKKLINIDGSELVKFKVDGESLTFLEALKKKNEFKKVYVMFGYNELGWPKANFKKFYTQFLNEIRKINPDAIIYVYCVIPIGRNPRDADVSVENNERIAEYNEVIREICKEGQYHYLNVQEVMIDNEGYLPDHAATDGIHPTVEYYKKWLEYTKSHTI